MALKKTVFVITISLSIFTATSQAMNNPGIKLETQQQVNAFKQEMRDEQITFFDAASRTIDVNSVNDFARLCGKLNGIGAMKEMKSLKQSVFSRLNHELRAANLITSVRLSFQEDFNRISQRAYKEQQENIFQQSDEEKS